MSQKPSKTGQRKKLEIIPYLPQEMDEFDAEIARYQRGEVLDNKFIPYRLVRGTYGQRQPDRQMIRVKAPGGVLTADQLDALGEVAEKYTPFKKGHITTRENIQYHHVLLPDATKVLRLIGEAGLSTREACGNTVRNVISCPFSGVCSDEVFDVTPYLTAYVRRFVRHSVTQAMPRKFKSAFSGCARDCAIGPIHDIAFVPVVRTENGTGRKGFTIKVGGGTSIQPRLADTVFEFVPVEDFLRVCEAILRVYNQSDELRKNRMAARIKVLLHRIGVERFRALVEEELKKEWAKQPIDPAPLMVHDDEATDAPALDAFASNGAAQSPEFLRWKATNVIPQKQPGYNVAVINVFQGDLSDTQFHALAALLRKYGGRARLTQQQNILFRYVPDTALPLLWKELHALSLGEPGADEITKVVSCPGTDSCKLGITSSMGLGRAVQETLLHLKATDALIRKMHVHISGCPNGCGQHHVGDIGFHGAAMKVEGNQVPSYEIFVGGHRSAGDNMRGDGVGTRLGQRVPVKVPAKRAPELVKRILAYYQETRQSEEPFYAFVDRVGTKPFEELAKEFKEVGPLGPDTIDSYIDWDKTILYKVERGEGECAV